MSWQLIQLADVSPTRWRNGGGETRELAAWPGSTDWTWRMSVAEVAASGPFSRFENVQRWFAVLNGGGVKLAVGSSEHELTCASDPFCFDGAIRTDCELLEGATQDFNLMVRSDRASARMERVRGSRHFVATASKVLAVYPVDAPATLCVEDESLVVPARTLAWRSLPAGAEVQVSAANALWMEIDR